MAIVQVGTNLQASWAPVLNAAYYEIWSNTTPSPNGAALVARTSSTTYDIPLNRASNGELIDLNPGFESGDLTGWTLGTDGTITWVLDTGTVHGGTYSAKTLNTANTLQCKFKPALASTVYTYSFWYDITANTGTFVVKLAYYDSSQTLLSTSTILSTGSTTAAWVNGTGTVTSPASTAYIAYQCIGASGVTAYVDDFSLTGSVAIASQLMYAIRAIDINGQAGPFNSWLQTTQPPAANGIPTSAHMQEDYVNARYIASNFQPQQFGSLVSPGGIDGKLLTPSDAIFKSRMFR